MYYIARVYLKNVRCFPDEVELILREPNEHRPSWTLLFGENGTGKTTLLRCIALGLCDKTRASGLLTELSGNLVRNGHEHAEIHIDLVPDDNSASRSTIATTIDKTDFGREEINQTYPRGARPRRADIFACGYGANYGTIGSQIQEQYDLIEALYTLFNYEARLQNPENALFRLEKDGANLASLLSDLDSVLLLPQGSTKLDSSGLRITGPWGSYVPATALADGYAATLAWICDFLGWCLLSKSYQPGEHTKGIVLLDEMERHLHPSWQRQIIPRLSAMFPSIQFIATTHAPMTAIGTASLPKGSGQLVVLRYNDGGVTVHSDLTLPSQARADQILTSELFNLPATTTDSTVQAIEEYSNLKSQGSSLSHAQRQRLELLDRHLAKTLTSTETDLQRQVQSAVNLTLDVLSGTEDFHRAALDYETKRQILNLFSRDSSGE